MAPNVSSDTERKCCGVSSYEIQEKREARRNKPQPWIVLKLAVFITIAIITYAWYVYVSRLCVPMIKRDAGALGSRGLGSECTPPSFIHLAHMTTDGFSVWQ